MNEDSKPTKQNYYNLKEGYTATNGLGYNFTVKELLTGGKVSISFREDKPPITIAAYNAFKGSVVNPYIAEEFVGEEHNTEKGGIFKVTKLLPREYYPDGTLKSAKYEGICSICSEDKELNPEPFNFDKSNMVLGKNITLPCQCSGRYDSVFRSEYKSKVVLSRFLGKSGLKLFSAWDGVVVKKSVVLYCPTHRKIICTELPRLISSKVSLCRSCRDDKLREDLISKHEKSVQNNFGISDFTIKGNKDKGFTFECGVCKLDNYTTLSNCRYIFPYSYSNLVNLNSLPCRCKVREDSSKTFKWDSDERSHQLKEIFKEEGAGEFIGWVTDYKGYKSKFNWVCKRGHFCETILHGFISKGNRCRICADIDREVSWSYNPKLEGKTDYLYIINLKNDVESFTKVGRTIDIKRRFGEYTCMFDLNVVSIYEGVYEDVWEYERDFHNNNKDLHYPSISKFYGRSECYILGSTFDMKSSKFKEVTKEVTIKYNYLTKEEL